MEISTGKKWVGFLGIRRRNTVFGLLNRVPTLEFRIGGTPRLLFIPFITIKFLIAVFLPASPFIPTSLFMNYQDFFQPPCLLHPPRLLFWPKFASLPVYSTLSFYLKLKSKIEIKLIL